MSELLAHAGIAHVAPLALVGAIGALQVMALLSARRRLGPRGPGSWRLVSLVAGIAALGFALSPVLPVHTTLTAHVVQHVLLVGVAAPLLVLGTPFTYFLCLLPPARRRLAHRMLPRCVIGLTAPYLYVALVAHLVTATAWHLPPLYEGALAVPLLHAAEHALLTGTAVLLWLGLVGAGPHVGPSAARLGALTALALHGALLGALVAFSTRPWYQTYERTLADPLGDQQQAGLVLWSLGGVAPVVAAFALVAVWLERPETAPAR